MPFDAIWRVFDAIRTSNAIWRVLEWIASAAALGISHDQSQLLVLQR